jgi:dihydroorotate dehydrogenase
VAEQEKISETILNHKIDGLIVSNTTIDRELNLKSKNAAEHGGLSGAPLFQKSNEVLKNFYKFTEGQIPLVGVGVRRIHDRNKAGWYLLIPLFNIYLLATPGDSGNNRFGGKAEKF